VRIGLCTDTHYWPQSGNLMGGEGNIQLVGESDRLLTQLTAELAVADLDLVLHLGDFTCGGGYFQMPLPDFYAAVDATHDALTQLRPPVYGLPGNHDCPPGGGRWTRVEECWGLSPGLGRTIDLPHARLVLINAQGHSDDQIEAAMPSDPIYGWVNEAELARFERALSTAGERPVIVGMHQLLRPWNNDHPWKDFYAVENADAVLETMARYNNVYAIFQGHAHRFDVQRAAVGGRNVWFIIAPAVMEYPLGWLHLTLTPGRLRVQLRSLDLPDLLDLTRDAGNGQAWRAGEPEWRDFTIDLH
jgi:3',5'-cyclic AMP phosphodiesterase CpdA